MMAELRRCKKERFVQIVDCGDEDEDPASSVVTYRLVFKDNVKGFLGDHGRMQLIQWVHVVVKVFHHICYKKTTNIILYQTVKDSC